MEYIDKKKVGVIGYGNFGKIVCQYLFPKNNILLFTSQKISPNERISVVNSLEQLIRETDIIVPAIPIHQWENMIKQIAPFVKKETIIIDILSVKEYSVNILQKYFSPDQYIATHPMFGPTSIRKNHNTIHGFTIVFCPIKKSPMYINLMRHFYKLGMIVKEMTPKQHDKSAAYSQFFSLVVRGMGKQLDISPTSIDTPGALAMLELLTYDFDKKIVEDMLQYNTYCSEVLSKIQATIKNLQDKQ